MLPVRQLEHAVDARAAAVFRKPGAEIRAHAIAIRDHVVEV
jgi:hypothetical protein